ncbi:MAG: glycosyltransferase [Methylococcales bacterium]|nr:glycosyltransferase [Methylococcales bacterium]
MRPAVTVCMATYNGAKFLNEQIYSIVKQLDVNDELLVVDDCSTDRSVTVIKEFSDSRIKVVHQSTNQGHVKSFEKAISLATNKIIFLADQDDIWLPGRLNFMAMELLNSSNLLVTSTFGLIDQAGAKLAAPPLAIRDNTSNHHLINILGIFLGRRPYFGCAMAFKSELLDIALPIPDFVESHDIWLAMISNMSRKNLHCEKQTLLRRIHSRNLSTVKPRSMDKILKTRLIFILSVAVISLRLGKYRLALLMNQPLR